MKVQFLKADVESHALDNVVAGLIQWAPSGTVVCHGQADVVVVPAIGRRDHVLRRCREAKAAGQRVVLHQYVLRTSMTPFCLDWLDVWQSVDLVYSYLPLTEWAAAEGFELPCAVYEAPLGVHDIFRTVASFRTPKVDILTSGRGWLTESVRECVLAARANGLQAEHLGTGISKSRALKSHAGLSLWDLRNLYRECRAVSGLRRIEGFELPAAEGACVGARPILFDQQHYRRWYDGFGLFITEGPRGMVLQQLQDLLAVDPRTGVSSVTRLTWEEREIARKRFDWMPIAANYWQLVKEI